MVASMRKKFIHYFQLKMLFSATKDLKISWLQED
jgi:hypothetical protein